MKLSDLLGKQQQSEQNDEQFDNDYYQGYNDVDDDAKEQKASKNDRNNAVEDDYYSPREKAQSDNREKNGGYEEPDYVSNADAYDDEAGADFYYRPYSKNGASEDVQEVDEPVSDETDDGQNAAEGEATETESFFRPESFADEREAMVDELLSGYIVYVNCSRLEKADLVRLFDYLSGAVQACSAELTRLDKNTIVMIPASSSVSPDDLTPPEDEIYDGIDDYSETEE